MTARILIVDDVAANLRLLEARLVAEYYEVQLACSGAEALELARTWGPDVILLDVMMPGMDGFEVCRRLKADQATAHIPVVMVTALLDTAERVRGLEAGADDFLSKPVDDATLFARLRALLRVAQVQAAWRLRAETARTLGFEPAPGPTLAVDGAQVLVLGADAAEARGIAGVLLDDGVLATVAASQDDAWARLDGAGFDLVVLCLPAAPAEDAVGADGDMLRLASRLRAGLETRDVPVLLVADASQRGLVIRGFELGANDHVLRPIDRNELRARSRNQIRRKRYQDRLRADLDRSLALAVTDPLTGLRNRRYVLRHLEGVLRASSAAVLMLDADHFKAINDSLGHNAGDMVLQEIAERLNRSLRAADVVARYGGEEFMVVLTGAPAEYAWSVAERLRQALRSEPVPIGDQPWRLTASIGIAVVAQGTAAEAAVTAADAALYRAKSLGRDRCEMAAQI